MKKATSSNNDITSPLTRRSLTIVSTHPSTATVEVPLKSKPFGKLVIFQLLWVASSVAGNIVIPLFGAQWFGSCLEEHGSRVSVAEVCSPDFVTYNFYGTLFSSIGGVVAFIFASFMGRLCDSLGRKAFLIIGVMLWMLPRCILVFHSNFYIYWFFCVAAEINGDSQMIPAFKASISDLISSSLRIQAFGIIHGAIGAGLIIGSSAAIVVSHVWNNYIVILVSAGASTSLLLFTTCCMRETIAVRLPLTSGIWSNPLKPLSVVFRNKFLLCLASMIFCQTMAETGVMCSLFAYLGHMLHLVDDGKTALLFGSYTATVSLVLIPTSVKFLPWLKKKNVHYSHMVCIAICMRISSMLLLACISLDVYTESFPAEYVLYSSAVLQGGGMFGSAVLQGAVSEYVAKDCQGIAFGVICSYKGIARIIAPFCFGVLFTRLNDTPFVASFIVLGILIYLVQAALALTLLKKYLKQTKPQSVVIRMAGEEFIESVLKPGRPSLQTEVSMSTTTKA